MTPPPAKPLKIHSGGALERLYHVLKKIVTCGPPRSPSLEDAGKLGLKSKRKPCKEVAINGGAEFLEGLPRKLAKHGGLIYWRDGPVLFQPPSKFHAFEPETLPIFVREYDGGLLLRTFQQIAGSFKENRRRNTPGLADFSPP